MRRKGAQFGHKITDYHPVETAANSVEPIEAIEAGTANESAQSVINR